MKLGILIPELIKFFVSMIVVYIATLMADFGNHKNTFRNAFLTAVLLSLSDKIPLMIYMGLGLWLYFLINQYSISFFRSVFCVLIYYYFVVFLKLALAASLIAGPFLISFFSDPGRVFVPVKQGIKFDMGKYVRQIPQGIKSIFGFSGENELSDGAGPKITVRLKNGRSFKGILLRETAEAYYFDVADGRSEVVVRRDDIRDITE